MQLPSEQIARRWLTYQQAEIYSGIGSRTLQNHVRAGFIRSSNACAPGSTRGRRLIDRRSLDEFIEAGVNAPMTQLVMNTRRTHARA